MKIQVGKKYKNRLGKTIYITHLNKVMVFPFCYAMVYIGNDHSFEPDEYSSRSLKFRKNGKVRDHDTHESMKDLIEEVILPEDTPTGKILYK